ncbi:MAG: helix-turn-helix transcriptional regulator [Nitrospirae bacterium]|nr:helix-turn-helix transcriptional regulator [Nitrospirota bacterium]MBI3352789.1 helix-turn-helix transcriptional regulator [Nitrospirota bacterium]
MLNIESRLAAFRKRQKLYDKQSAEAKPVLESQFGDIIYPHIMRSLEGFSVSRSKAFVPVSKKKIRIRIKEDPRKVIAWAIAQRIREARENRGLRQEDLARMTGIARPNIVRIEQGRHVPSLTTLRKIVDALGLDINRLTAEPDVEAEERLEFAELAESGIAEWEKSLKEEDKRD